MKREASATPSEAVSFWDAACSVKPHEGDLPARKKLQVTSSFASERASKRLRTCVHNNSLGRLGNLSVVHSVDLASWHCFMSAAMPSQIDGSGSAALHGDVILLMRKA